MRPLPSDERTLAYVFSLRNMLTSTAQRCFSYSLLTHLILERMEHTIPYIVSTLFFPLNFSESDNILSALVSVSVLNLHRDGRQTPEILRLRIGFPWDGCQVSMTIRQSLRDQDKAITLAMPEKIGYFMNILHNWDDVTRNPQNIQVVWGDQVRQQTRLFLGGLMGINQ